ncbi:MAG: hypothetical protein QXD43_02690 [Candidatus Aenigmatarchaeota archaeon]
MKRMYQVISRKENFPLPGLLDNKQTLSYSKDVHFVLIPAQ